jgi:hypothetical protein
MPWPQRVPIRMSIRAHATSWVETGAGEPALPPDRPATTARVKGGLRPSQAIEQTAPDP